MEEKFYKTELNIKNREFAILTPVRDFEGLYACTENLDYLTLFGDIKNLMRLAGLFAIMHNEKSPIIYLPLRKHGLTSYLKTYQGENSGKDIVILHHAAQFNIKDWKLIRRQLINKEIIKYKIENEMFSSIDEDFRIFNYKTNKDVLDLRNQFETIFFVASSKVFGSLANDCKDLAESEPDEFYKKYEGYHDHKHLDMYLRNNIDTNISIDYYDKKLWGS